MKLLNPVIIILFSIIILSSCAKNPNACFDVSNETPYVGEEVQFTNCSTEADSYVWDFGDGNTSGYDTATHIYQTTGTYVASLLALAGEDNSHFVTKSIVVEEDPALLDYGKVVFWRQGNVPFDSPTVALYFYNMPEGYLDQGTLTETFEFAPDCDTQGALTIELPTDVTIAWQVTNTNNGHTEDRPAFSVEKDECMKLRVD